jgi:hypothetical protein
VQISTKVRGPRSLVMRVILAGSAQGGVSGEFHVGVASDWAAV